MKVFLKISFDVAGLMLDGLMEEVRRDYRTSIRKSIIHYLLLSASECERLGLEDLAKVLDKLALEQEEMRWCVAECRPPVSWHSTKLDSAERCMRKLCRFNQGVVGLCEIWTRFSGIVFPLFLVMEMTYPFPSQLLYLRWVPALKSTVLRFMFSGGI